MCIIYCIHCYETNKKYIGSCEDLDRRIHQHFRPSTKNHCNNILYEDIEMYPDKFVYGVIEEVDTHMRYIRERYWIEYYDTIQYGYNISLPKYTLTEEDKREYFREYNKTYDRKGWYEKYKDTHNKKRREKYMSSQRVLLTEEEKREKARLRNIEYRKRNRDKINERQRESRRKKRE